MSFRYSEDQLSKMPGPVQTFWRLGLSSEEMERFLLTVPWFVQPDDLIGGWCITPLPYPPGDGTPEIASFISEDIAHYIVSLHNQRLSGDQQRDGEA